MQIITAIGNPNLKNKLEEENFDVFYYDIQYQEAVIDVLKKYKEIEILYLNSLLPGDYSIYEFINKIKKLNSKIKIIIILEKENEEIKNFLNSKNIFDIFYNNKIKIEELINLIKNNKIIKNKEKNNKNKKIIKLKQKANIIKNKMLIKKNNPVKNENKILNIIGPPGSRKNNFFNIICLFFEQ